MAEDAKSIRRTAKARFTRKRNELLKSMDADQGREMVEGNYVKLFEAWDIVESKHDLYTMYLTDEELEVAERWITELKSSIYRTQLDQKLSRERPHYVMNQK